VKRGFGRVFGVEIVFDHYGKHFHYVPEVEVPNSSLIIGRIGRARPVVENEPPEEGMHEIERESWIAAGVVIDPRAHDDGQKAAIEDNWRVGKPASIFKSLTKRINNADEPYVIEANPIVDPQRSGNSSGKIAAKSRLCHSICSRQICSGCEASWTKRCESCATTKKSAKLN
jgi:hypothetical protein